MLRLRPIVVALGLLATVAPVAPVSAAPAPEIDRLAMTARRLADGAVRVSARLTSAGQPVRGAKVQAELRAEGRKKVVVRLEPVEAGRYAVTTSRLPAGAWTVRVVARKGRSTLTATVTLR